MQPNKRINWFAWSQFAGYLAIFIIDISEVCHVPRWVHLLACCMLFAQNALKTKDTNA